MAFILPCNIHPLHAFSPILQCRLYTLLIATYTQHSRVSLSVTETGRSSIISQPAHTVGFYRLMLDNFQTTPPPLYFPAWMALTSSVDTTSEARIHSFIHACKLGRAHLTSRSSERASGFRQVVSKTRLDIFDPRIPAPLADAHPTFASGSWRWLADVREREYHETNSLSSLATHIALPPPSVSGCRWSASHIWKQVFACHRQAGFLRKTIRPFARHRIQ